MNKLLRTVEGYAENNKHVTAVMSNEVQGLLTTSFRSVKGEVPELHFFTKNNRLKARVVMLDKADDTLFRSKLLRGNKLRAVIKKQVAAKRARRMIQFLDSLV